MTQNRPVVLLTGFGPFPGVAENATQRLVPLLRTRAARAFPQARFEAYILPTEWERAASDVAGLYEAYQPCAAIHFGVSSRARGFEIETRAYNLRAAVKDAAGHLPPSPCIAQNGPDVLPSGLPVSLILARLRQRQIPAFLSRDAGRYLCNALLYVSTDMVRRSGGGAKSGFVHVPASLVHRGRSRAQSAPALSWQQALVGALEIVGATLASPSVR